MTVRLGRWQDVLADVEQCDAVICDPPYGARTHASAPVRGDDVDEAGLAPAYDAWTEEHVRAFFAHWSDRCRGWIVLLTDSELSSTIRRVAEEAGRCSFAPVPCVMRGMSVRLQGDGPSSWSVYAMASRPRNAEMVKWGTLPGAYTGAPSREAGGGRGKPAWLMRALVGDYSRPGDLVVDPFAGWGSTLEAAIGLDRRALGAEMDPEAHAECLRRLKRPAQRDLFAGAVSL